MTRSSIHPVATEEIAIDTSRAQPLGGRYRLDGVVGRGGMGTVYRALDLRLNRPVALKVLRSVEESDADRFEAEIQILARLVHPGLVRLLDAGDFESRPYLVMDLIEGPSLAESVSEGPLSRESTAIIGSRIATALAYVHGAGVVHRDVKPANVLLTPAGDAQLADFGIARLVDSTSITVTGRPLGTPAYLAPEQVEGTTVGPATDVYALGLVLIECLSGRRAFEGSPSEIAGARLHHDPVVPWEVGEGWRHTLAAMTRRSPADRISAVDASSQLDALARVDAYLALITDPWGDVAVTAPLASDGAPDPTDTATQVLAEPTKVQVRAVRRRRRLAPRHARQLTIGAAAAALLAGVAVAAPWSDPPSPVTALVAHLKSHTATGATTSTSVITSTTSTTSPSASRGVVSAVTALDTAITAGENNGTINVAAAPPLIARVNALLTSSPTSSPSQAQQLNRVVQQFKGDVQSGQIVGGATIGALAASIDGLATALGSTLSVLTTANPSGVGGPGGPGQGHGRGHDH